MFGDAATWQTGERSILHSETDELRIYGGCVKNLSLIQGGQTVLITLWVACGCALAQPSPPAFYYFGGGSANAAGATSTGIESGCVAATSTPVVPASIAQYFTGCSIGSTLTQSQSFVASNGGVVATGSAAEAGAVSPTAGLTLSSAVSNNTFNVQNDPPFGEFSSSEVIYYQAGFVSAVGSTVTLSYPVNSNIDNRGSFSMVSITLASQDGTDFNYASVGIPPTTIATGVQTQTLITTPLTIGDSGTYSITIVLQTVINNGAGEETLSIGGCPVLVSLSKGDELRRFGSLGANLPYILGQFTPPNGENLETYAQRCGFSSFSWQQQITSLAAPNGFIPVQPTLVNPANLSANGSLQVLPGGPTIYDPVIGGYTYQVDAYNPNPYPFYYQTPIYFNPSPPYTGTLCTVPVNPVVVGGCPEVFPWVIDPGDLTLSFLDAPALGSLPSGEQIASFITSLVGVTFAADGITAIPSSPLFTWTWYSTFNARPLGGISQTSLSYPIDPGSGTGGVTITSINGIPLTLLTSSQITATASGLAYSRVSKTFNGTVTLTNISGSAITTPAQFQLVLAGLPSGVTVPNAAGTFNLSAYVTVPSLATLGPGQSVSVAVQFSNPSNVSIDFTPLVYTGSFK